MSASVLAHIVSEQHLGSEQPRHTRQQWGAAPSLPRPGSAPFEKILFLMLSHFRLANPGSPSASPCSHTQAAKKYIPPPFLPTHEHAPEGSHTWPQPKMEMQCKRLLVRLAAQQKKNKLGGVPSHAPRSRQQGPQTFGDAATGGAMSLIGVLTYVIWNGG